jgi:hypothetical protein
MICALSTDKASNIVVFLCNLLTNDREIIVLPVLGKVLELCFGNQNKVSEWSDMSTRGLFVQTKGICLRRHYLIECNLFSPWFSWNIAQLALSNNHSLAILYQSKNCGHRIHVLFMMYDVYWYCHVFSYMICALSTDKILCTDIPLVICPLVISVGRIKIGFEENLRYVLKASIYCLKTFCARVSCYCLTPIVQYFN